MLPSAADASPLNASRSSSPASPRTPTPESHTPEESNRSSFVLKNHTTVSSSCVPSPSTLASSFELESSHATTDSHHSSPSGSPGDTADTEIDGGLHKPSTSDSALKVPPPKKRTRTLTTPHQTAVLRAHFAKSQFPPTQTHQQIGKSIGLTARKVQIWFQNQRQKARQPPATSPLTRQPCMGDFANRLLENVISSTPMTVSSGSSIEDFPPSGPDDTRETPHSDAGLFSRGTYGLYPPPRDAYFSEEHRRSGISTTQLPSLGMLSSIRRDIVDDFVWEGPSQSFPSSPFRPPLTEPLKTYRVTPPPSCPSSRQEPEITHGFSWSLTHARSLPGAVRVGTSNPTLASLSALECSASVHHGYNLPPVDIDFSTPRLPLNIPPPFTLQPQPLWDDPAFSPYSRHGQCFTVRHHSPEPRTEYRSRSGDLQHFYTPSLPLYRPSPVGCPLSPVHRSRFDPIRSTTGRASPDHLTLGSLAHKTTPCI